MSLQWLLLLVIPLCHRRHLRLLSRRHRHVVLLRVCIRSCRGLTVLRCNLQSLCCSVIVLRHLRSQLATEGRRDK